MLKELPQHTGFTLYRIADYTGLTPCLRSVNVSSLDL